MALRAANFADIVLQDWDANLRDSYFQDKMKSCISTIVKGVMQTQTSITFGCLQLRRDHYLAHTRGRSPDATQQLRHAPALDWTRLFPLSFMADINMTKQDSLQTKALLRISSASTRSSRNDRGRVNRRGSGHRGMYNHNNNQSRDDQLSSFEYESPTTRPSRIPTVTGAACDKFRGPRLLKLL